MEISVIEDAVSVAHGCRAKGNGQTPFDVATRALNPSLKVIAPVGEWKMSRSAEIEYARKRGTAIPATINGPYRTDSNLWGRSIAGGVLEDGWREPPENVYTLTKSPAECPD